MAVRSANRQQLSGLFSPGTVLIPPPGQPEREILHQLLDRLEQAGRLDDATSALEIMFNHRCCSFIELAAEVAVVHSKLKTVPELTLAMAVSPSRISCECLAPAVHRFRVLILVLTPFGEPSGYIRVLTALKRVLGEPEWIERLCSLKDAESVWRLFDDRRVALPEYVSAGDIMRTEMRVLRDTDSLSTAIDTFCEFDLTELPVVDKDGDLVGVVSEDELLRICLPEYVTWTEDLSSILDFEPFAEVLRREEEMPLMEIMLFAERYAAVQEDTPAIEVAKTMMRNDIQQVLVTRGQRLIGLISLSDFIRKVLRA
ncbi:MAG: CBS domain-containing protein [Gammaproteobacteria bacterium]|nr:CBS domain-containing protein [Gammaproteobacteria bacterium]